MSRAQLLDKERNAIDASNRDLFDRLLEIGIGLRAHDQILVVEDQGGHAAQVVVLGQGDVGVNGFAPGGISEDGPDVGLGQPGRLP